MLLSQVGASSLALLNLSRSAFSVVRETPALGYLVALVACGLFWPFLRRTISNRPALLPRINAGLGLLTLLAFLALAFLSLHSFLLSDDEANILSIAAAALHGQPAYPSVHSYDFSYGLLYGPLTFLVPGLLFRLFHGAFWPLHLSVVLVNLFLCAILWLTARRYLSRSLSLAVLAYPLAVLIRVIDHTLGLRSEPGLFFFTTLATFFTLAGPPLTASVLAGVCAGLALGFKLTTLPAAAFLLLLLFRRRGPLASALAAAALILTSFAPFLLPAYSLHNYLDSFLNARSEPPSNFLLLSVLFAFSLLLPFVILRCFGVRPWSPPQARFGAVPEITVLILGLLAATFVAAKPGGGLWHICQFVPPLIGYLILTLAAAPQQPGLTTRLSLAIFVIALGSALYGLSFVPRNLVALRPPPSRQLTQARQEIDGTLASFPNQTLQVGYGANPNALPSLLRFIPVLRGQPYTLDGSGRIEVIPNPFPPGILNRMRQCHDDLWLIPSGQSPFDNPFFPPELHDVFVSHFTIARRQAVYDLWSCNADSNAAR